MPLPQVSIIVPIYKVEKYLPTCIESALGQTFENFELILVDDGSPDDCPQICDHYASVDSRVVTIHKTNGGLSSARNAGMEKARGLFVFHLDGDDSIPCNALELLTNKQKETDADLVIGDYTAVSSNHSQSYVSREFETEKHKYLLKIASDLGYPHYIWGILIRRSLYIENDIHPQNGANAGEDLQILPQLIFHSNSYVKLDAPVYNYTITNISSISSKYSYNRLWEDIASIDVVLSFFAEEGYELQFFELQKAKLLYISNALARLCLIEDDSSYTKAINLANDSSLRGYKNTLPAFLAPIPNIKRRRITVLYIRIAKSLITIKKKLG